MKTILLGPQRRPTLEAVVRSLGLPGPFATVTMCGMPPRIERFGPFVGIDESGTDSSFHNRMWCSK